MVCSFVNDIAVHEQIVDTLGARNQARLIPRKVMHHLCGTGLHLLQIEYDDVRCQSFPDQPAIPDSVQRGWHERHAPYRLLKGQDALLAHPVTQSERRVVGATDLICVGSSVRYAQDALREVKDAPYRFE